MRRRLSVMVLGVALGLLTSCNGDGVGPIVHEVETTVITRNLYLGTALTSELSNTPPQEIPLAVAALWANVQATDFPARAVALADEVDEVRPDLIGLQEATLYRRQSPGDALQGNPVQAGTVVLDFMEILLDELSARGLSYSAAALLETTDVELPLATPTGLDDIRLTDRDAILVRDGVNVANPRGGLYATNLVVPVGDVFNLVILRGWTAVDVRIGGVSFGFWNTHLETAEEGPAVQALQAQELLNRLSVEAEPLVAVGDFNSAADGSTTPTYATLTASGFDDAWSGAPDAGSGYTCCQEADLGNVASLLTRRIDLIFTRGDVASLSVTLLGAAEATKTPAGLWPSDHAGVAATLRVTSR